MTLAEYVKKRNGVAMGANNSLRNMISRSLGANTFSVFWRYWNPIWSFYLGTYIFKPLKTILPPTLALLLTFGFCGFLHDVVIMLVRWDFALLFTPWFVLMGLWLVISDFIKLNYSNYPWIVRAFINIFIIGSCFIIAYQIRV